MHSLKAGVRKGPDIAGLIVTIIEISLVNGVAPRMPVRPDQITVALLYRGSIGAGAGNAGQQYDCGNDSPFHNRCPFLFERPRPLKVGRARLRVRSNGLGYKFDMLPIGQGA
jgi:hypothetical protein